MKKETYLRMVDTLKAKPALAKTVITANSLVTKAIYIAYPCLLIALFAIEYLFGDTAPSPTQSLFFASLIIPLVSFLLLSVIRKGINAKRPYEVFETSPVIPKSTKGKSFPSRHVFSIFVIGTTFLYACPIPALGIVVLILGVLLAVLRVVSGVHFPRDVIAGSLFGIACSIIGFALWF